jgi:predicted unusual protein kinase regulating ubiquinone biosynthesis (AarF/ABC1/UbiB family)
VRVWLAARLAPLRDEATRRRAEERLWAHEGRRLARAATVLGGLLIKVGQFLSTRVDLFPEAFTRELAGLRDVVPAVAWPAVAAVLARAYGPGPVEGPDGAFGSVEREPLAAASLAQVHRARLHGGETVVLKILRPGIASLVETDLATISWVLGWTGRHTAWGRRYDLGAIAREFAEVTRQELDMPGEGDRAQRFAAMFADDPRVRAPRVYRELTRPEVLVLAEVQGVAPVRERVLAAGLDPTRVADLLLESYMRQWLTEGLFHADPHAGNLFVQDDGSLAYVDFGMMAEIGPQDRAALRQLVLAVVARDPDGAADAMDALGFLRPGVDRRPLERALAFLLTRMFAPEGEAMRARDTAELDALLVEMRAFLHEHPFQIPARYAFLGRALGMLAGMTAELAPDAPFLPALARAARRELGRPGRRADAAGPFADVDWRAVAAAAAGWLRGEEGAAVALAEALLPTWRRLTRGPMALMRLMRRLERGEVVLAPRVDRPAARAGARAPRAILAAGSAIAAAVVGGQAPLGRDLLWVLAAALAALSLVG